ncbi:MULTISPECIES: hypothetical protein [unclassified Xanthobacter]|uniref:hypothetical protein n=1 Tax=unclassified Xanthobacter TaxID=2623496 RepID=UPI001EDEE0C8|nr:MULTISPECIES: hypothetical protein [unclassified Xanthobacter]
MWVVVVLVLSALVKPEVAVNRETSYPTEEACKAAIAKNIPARLDAKNKEAFAEGYRRYVCIRVPTDAKTGAAKPDAAKPQAGASPAGKPPLPQQVPAPK